MGTHRSIGEWLADDPGRNAVQTAPPPAKPRLKLLLIAIELVAGALVPIGLSVKLWPISYSLADVVSISH